MLKSNAGELDRFMEANGAFDGNPNDGLESCIGTLPERVKASVLLEPSLEYFRDVAG
jgi:hypothetical protein